jgi:hypothetical protein
MNVRYPASSTGMWGQLKRTQVVAALTATIGVMVGAAGAVAWDRADDSGSTARVYAPPPAVNIDRLAAAASAPEGPGFAGTSGGDLIAGFGHGFVDVASLEAAIGPVTPATTIGESSLEAAIAQHENALAGNGIVDVASLEAAIGPVTPATTIGEFSPEAAQHDNALTGNGIVDDTADAAVGPFSPKSREGARGQVFSD